jgi:hypothetical protein
MLHRASDWIDSLEHSGGKRNAYRILVGKPEGMRAVGRPRHRWANNIKVEK